MSENSEDGWIEHDGKGMPLDGDTLIYAKFRDGWAWEPPRGALAAKRWQPWWIHSPPSGSDIIAYRVVKP